jgi:membrane associated rhomboid family serine protease
MEPAYGSTRPRWVEILLSPTIAVSIVLILVYLIVGVAAGNLLEPLQPIPLVDLLVQCDNPLPIFPWTILTAIFLHVSPVHIASNLVFLLLFGFILQEQVPKSKWLATFFITGVVGSVSFVLWDVAGYALTGFHNPNSFPDCAVGASGAVYGIIGTAVGLRGAIILILLFGLDIFAGGGTPAHLGGLAAGLALRQYWSLARRPFGGI